MAKVSSSGEEKIEAAKEEDVVKEFRTSLAKLGLRKIEDIDKKRVQNPEATINALANLFSAIK